ncbi:MAG TPA: Dam family site-specific DNA-(adenine-N6)-methyltransferase [Candidatus Ligilactobacillus avistercoris]|nr:Dam family site-specific DNA-(adenine-N6)-methyltransferase [Candidatus Ligilactobacillus avistercoris]
MRYIGNKTRLLSQLDNLLNEKGIESGVFADLFAGTGSVADHFKDKFQIIANDIENYAAVFSQAKTNNPDVPKFNKFVNIIGMSPFDYFNNIDPEQLPGDGFITQNYSPVGNRMFFKINNAKKIDFIRSKINEFKSSGIISENEYIFLLASLLESVMRISNTSGTYEAFFKTWENRAKNDLILKPLTIEKKPIYSYENSIFSENANDLVRKVKGDIAYIDTPYTVTQYASAYHLLETITLNDNPILVGKTGRRVNRRMSEYNRRSKVADQFHDLFRQIQFKSVVVSYSNQALLSLDELINIIKEYAVSGSIDVKKIRFKEYRNLNKSQKANGKCLQEFLIYFEKDLKIIKSPLNYAGSKDKIVPTIIKNLPKSITTFVDCMAGAWNVGANIKGVNKVVFNDKQSIITNLMNQLASNPSDIIINNVKNIINYYHLKKSNKDGYLKLREDFNSVSYDKRDPFKLFVLSLYSFQHMIRFNSRGEYNVPVGNSGYNEDVESRIITFSDYFVKHKYQVNSQAAANIDYKKFDKKSIFYFDPPYIVTSAAYNDGNRMDVRWTERDEEDLLGYLNRLNSDGYRFLLSNVLTHHGQTNESLKEWINNNNFTCILIGKTGRRFPRTEILVKNY